MKRATALILIAAGLLIVASEVDQWRKMKALEREVLELQKRYESSRH